MAVGDLQYAFNPAIGETPQTIAAKRALALAIMGNTSHAPRDIGEGLNSIGQAIMYRNLMKGVTNAETAGNSGASKVFQSLFGDQFPAAPSATSPTPPQGGSLPSVDISKTASGSVDPQMIYSGLKARGLNDAQAYATLGNWKQESEFRPGAVNPGEGAIGFDQWRLGRRADLEKFAGAAGKSPTDPEVQMDFYIDELKRHPGGKAFMSATDIPSANAALKQYILYGSPYDKGGEGTRLANALAYQKRFGAAATDAPPQPQQVASLDQSVGLPPAQPAVPAMPLPAQAPVPQPNPMLAAGNDPSADAPASALAYASPQMPPMDAKAAIARAMAGQGQGQTVPPEMGRQGVPLSNNAHDVVNAGLWPRGGQRVLDAMMQQQPIGGPPMGMQAPPSAPMPPQAVQPPPAPEAAPMPDQSGKPQGPGTPGEIRKGSDGKNYQYAQTTGMADATGDQGWIETSMPAPDTAPVPPQVAPADAGGLAPQVAQAAPPLPPPTTVQDQPIASPQGPDASQLPAMAGGNSDVVAPGSQQGPSVQQLMQAASDPWVMARYGPIVEALVQQKMKQGDPSYALDLAKKRMDIQLEQQQLGGSFRGDSLDAQAWNILQTRDPGSKEYATAYSIVSQPKTQLVQTANGLVPVQVPPNLPAWVKNPGDAGGPSVAPAGAAPGGAPAAPATAQPAGAPAAPGSPAAAGAPIPGTKQPATEMQARNGAIGKILLGEVPTLGANFKALSDPKGQLLNALPGGIGNAWQSPEYQQAANAVKASVANVLYSLSGASSNPGEVLNQIGILTPAFGDAPATIADKLQRFKTYVRAISSEANDPDLTKNVEDAIAKMDAPAAASPEGQAPAGAKNKTSSGVEWSISP